MLTKEPLLSADALGSSLAPVPSSISRSDNCGDGAATSVVKVQMPRLHFWMIIASMLIAYFLSALDTTIVIVALPVIVGDIGGLHLFGYVMSLYLLTSACTGPLFGKLSDVYGRKRVFVAALSLFMAGSIACGGATSIFMLIISRAVQGVGGGGLSMLTQIIFADVMTPKERAQFASMTSMMIAVASLAGPLVGGVFADVGLWRWIFFINIPFVFVSAVLAMRYVTYDLPSVAPSTAVVTLNNDESGPIVRPAMDYLGSLFSMGGIALILLACGTGGSNDEFWASGSSLVMLIGGLACVGLFFGVEYKVASPIIPLRLFLIRNVNISCLVMFTSNLAQLTSLMLFSLYFQVVKNDSARDTGLNLLPMLLSLVLCATLTGNIMAKTGLYRPFLVAGSICCGFGVYIQTWLQPDSPYWIAASGMVVIGLGYGFVAPVVKVISQNAVPNADIAAVTVMTIFFRNLGAALGCGVYSSVFAMLLRRNVRATFGSDHGSILENFTLDELRDPTHVSPADLASYLQAYTTALDSTFAYMAPVMALALIPCLLTHQVLLKDRKQPPPQQLEASRPCTVSIVKLTPDLRSNPLASYRLFEDGDAEVMATASDSDVLSDAPELDSTTP